MSAWKQPSILSNNKYELKACIMILETNRQEGEEYLFYSYKTNDNCLSLLNLKGVLLASVGISNTIFGDDYRILTFKDTQKDDLYKVCSRSFLKQYILSVVVPHITPDNIVVYLCNEYIKFLNFFFENFEDSKKFTELLTKYAEILLYNIMSYALDREKEDFYGSALTVMPVINMTFNYNEITPCFLIKPPLSDNLRTELIEILNTLNSDKTVLQETLTLMEPPFYVRGYTLLYRGFVMFNTLNNKEMSNITRLAMLHEMYDRSPTSNELLLCEFIFENECFDNPTNINLEEKKKILVTILAQREFVILIYLDILGKNNCSFDPFYHKRAEDLLISLLKKGYPAIINNELHTNSIKTTEDVLNEKEENSFNDLDSVKLKNSENSNLVFTRKNSNRESSINTDMLTTKLRGYIDHETKVNIIHFSCYDDSECVINTTDIYVTKTIFTEIYRNIFKEYARIQSNINKLKNRTKQINLSKIYSYENISQNYKNVLRNEANIKTKLLRQQYIKHLKQVKFNEYSVKLSIKNNIPIWVCCKIYLHTSLEDEMNFEEFSNYKIIFVSYESHVPVDLDSFCQDLLLNEQFI
jgi:hypothetical protein